MIQARRWEDLQAAISQSPDLPRGASLFAVSVVAGGALVRVTVELEGWAEDEALIAYVPTVMSTAHAILAAQIYQYLLHTHDQTRAYIGLEDDDETDPIMPEGQRFHA